MSVVKNLQQDVHHVRVRLFDLVEEHYAVGLAADLFGELSGLVIAHVARGRPDDARDGELLHKLGHVEADQALGRIEHIGGKLLDKLRLADAGGADEDKAHGLALDLQPDAAAANGGADGIHRLVLADDAGFETFVQLCKALQLILADGGGGNLCPELDNAGEVIHRQCRARLCVQLPQLGLALHLTASELRDTGVALVEHLLRKFLPLGRIGAHQRLALEADVLQILLRLHAAVDVRMLEIDVGAGLVNEVDGLIRQEAVGNVALAEQDSLTAHLIADDDAVVFLIVRGDAAQDLHAVLDRRFIDRDRLETALKRGVLFDMLAVLGEGRGADDLDLASGKGGLEDVGGVHAALGIARADDIMHLVDDENNVALLADLFDESLHAAFKLTAKLRPRHQRREIQQVNLLIPELHGHVAVCDTLGKAFGDGGLADTRFADETGIVLLAAVEDLDHALQLLLAPDHPVKLALLRALGQVDAIVIQELPLAALGGLLRVFPAVVLLRGRGRRIVGIAVPAAEETVQKREGGGLAVVVPALIVLVHGGEILHAAERVHHLARQALQILVREAHFVDHVVHGLDVQLTRALEAQTFVFGLAGFYFCDKDHRDIFAAAGA